MDKLMQKAMEKHKIVRYQQSFVNVMTSYKSFLEAENEQLNKLSVSGKQPDYKTIHAAAVEYAQKEWAHANDVDTEKKYSSNDFHAGAQWALSQVAGVCSGLDKTT